MVEPYNVVVVGGGVAEHALAGALADEGADVYAIADESNPGIGGIAEAFVTVDLDDPEAVAAVVDGWDHVFAFGVAPRPTLTRSGVVDELLAAGLDMASPGGEAARIGEDATWLRRTMEKQGYGGTLRWDVFETADGLGDRIETLGDVAVRPIGPSPLSRWVFGPEETEAAIDYAERILEGGPDARALVEEALRGERFTLAAITDGRSVHGFPVVGTHREALGTGASTARRPVAAYSGPGAGIPGLYEVDRESAERRIEVLVRGLSRQNVLYRGPITGEFVLTADGPRLVDVDSGWPDLVWATLAPRLEEGLRESLYRVATVSQTFTAPRWAAEAAVAERVRPVREPDDRMATDPVRLDRAAIEAAGARVYHGAGERVDGAIRVTDPATLVIAGGGETLAEAAEVVAEACEQVAGPRFVTGRVVGEAYFEAQAERIRSVRTDPPKSGTGDGRRDER